ncbi:MAG TPA: ornithine carbamoyltransferase [Candidatus Dormibacteraeota bacterium]|nr:ornithine carbamoyltransferase [Candidatus Dormibacteraeota bacterium]HEX2681456.1 ornithine carbamoyltransferase [Candidatus Dormibacteraeota bacterium]
MRSLKGRDFIDIADLDPNQLGKLLGLAHAIKAGAWREKPLQGKHMAMLFQRPSHRTRVSFEVGIAKLGGTMTTLGAQDVQLGFRESVSDAAHVLDRYVDGVIARLRLHADLLQLANSSEKPVINALTDRSHPCQVLADLMTLEEVAGDLTRQHVVYIGDGNNIATSLLEASALSGFALTVITPPGYDPDPAAVERARRLDSGANHMMLTNTVRLDHPTAVYTDVWASMGQEDERTARRTAFARYQVNQALMDQAPGAVFMHCLPAHRGEEVTDQVMDGPRSVVFQQAENRLWAQMALMAEIFG